MEVTLPNGQKVTLDMTKQVWHLTQALHGCLGQRQHFEIGSAKSEKVCIVQWVGQGRTCLPRLAFLGFFFSYHSKDSVVTLFFVCN